MLEFYGTFIKTIGLLNKSTGEREFLVEPQRNACLPEKLWYTDRILVKGQIYGCRKGTPLLIRGDMAESPTGTYVAAESCCEKAGDRAMAAAFLISGNFPGVGPATAGRIIDVTGIELFEFAKKDDAERILIEKTGIREHTASMLIQVLKRPSVFQELVSCLTKKGATFEDAEDLLASFGNDVVDVVKHSPYRLLDYGIRLEICDRIAQDLGIHFLNSARIRAIIRQIMKHTEESGDSYIPFSYLCDTVYTEYGDPKQIAPFFVAAAVLKEKTCTVAYEENEIRVYQSDIYKAERLAAARVVRGFRTACQYPKEKIDINAIEKALSIRYADKQKESFSLLHKSGTAILIGGPGMGKTTLEKGYIMAFRQMFPNAVISLCAPTAAAAKRMRDATGFQADTIHRLLEVRPTGRGDYVSKDEYSTLAADLVIADECSMIDTKLFSMLVRAMKPGSLLVLVGDDGQLASVGSGCVLRDLIACPEIPHCRLDTYFRQNGNSTIVTNGVKIRSGDTKLIQDASFEIVRVPDEHAAFEETIRQMETAYDRKDPMKCRLYTTARKRRYLCSTETLNEVLQEKFNRENVPAVRRGNILLKEGDPVVFTRNNYTDGYCNGDEGVIVSVGETNTGTSFVTVNMNTENLDVKGENLLDLLPAYALTVHKAQGAECETSIVLLPKKPSALLDRNLILVAATRAKKKNIIITENDALEQAIRSTRQMMRRTGLALRLQEALTSQ